MVWDNFLKPDSRQVRLEDQEVSKDQEEFCLRKNPPKTNGWFTWFQDAETKFGSSPFSRGLLSILQVKQPLVLAGGAHADTGGIFI